MRAHLAQSLIGSHGKGMGLIPGAAPVQKVSQLSNLEAAVSARRAKGLDETRIDPGTEGHWMHAEEVARFGQGQPFRDGLVHVKMIKAYIKYRILHKSL